MEANVSQDDANLLNQKLRKQLVNGLKGGTEGILRERDDQGHPIVPFSHQRTAVYEMVRCKEAFLLAHAMGLGKTLTCIFTIAAYKLVLKRVPKTFIACPSKLISYWKECILNTLRIHPDTVLVVDKASKITQLALSKADIVIISRDIVAGVFGKCFHKVGRARQVQTGVGLRWANAYVRTRTVKLSPLFGKSEHILPSEPSEATEQVEEVDEEEEDYEGYNSEEEIGNDGSMLGQVMQEMQAAGALDEDQEGDDHAVEVALGQAGQVGQEDQVEEEQTQVQYRDVLHKFDLLFCDEAHGFCNQNAKRSKAFCFFSKLFSKRFAVTGTPIRNRQEDIASICATLRFAKDPVDFGRRENWNYNNDSRILNEFTNVKFAKFVSRVNESDIKLPELTKTAVNMEIVLPPDLTIVYNEAVGRAKNLRREIQFAQDHGFAKLALAQLIGLIQKLSFLITCPLLAEHGAADVKNDYELVQRAADNPTSAMFELVRELRSLQSKGHERIVVAGVHVSLLTVVSKFIEREAPGLGEHFHYNGSLSNKKKDEVKFSFLNSNVGLLFLSVKSGGEGLHLVPGCQAMVLFGAAPWAAAECDQLFKRIHRIGQDKPVSITYMLAHGTVDASIYAIHGCKRRLEKMTVSTWKQATDIRANRMEKRGLKRMGISVASASSASAASSSNNANNADDDEDDEEDEEGEGETTGKTWRRAARIVDALLKVNEDTGSFPPMPERVYSSEGTDLGAFTLVPGVATRGLSDDVPEDAVPLAKEEEEEEEEEHAPENDENVPPEQEVEEMEGSDEEDGEEDGEEDPPVDAMHNLAPPHEEGMEGMEGMGVVLAQ